MNDFTTDPLARRLETLDLGIEPHTIPRRALMAYRSAPARGRARPIVVASLVPVVLALFAMVASYYAPSFAQAVADAPVAGAITGPLLRGLGLAGIPQRISAFGDVATSSGYQAQLVGGYADSARTVLFVRLTPAARVDLATPGVRLTLNDQFGTSYQMTGAVGNTEAGETALIFKSLTGPAAALGARLALSFDTLEERSRDVAHSIKGY